MSNSGTITFEFTQKLDVPDDAANIIRESAEANRRLLAAGEEPESSMVEVFALMLDSDEDEVPSDRPVMRDWDLISISSGGLAINLNFADPITVSTNSTPDLLLIQLNLSMF